MNIGNRLKMAADLIFRPQAANELRQYESIDELIKEARRGLVSASGEYVDVTSAQRVAAVYACVRVVREAIAHLPLVIYRTDGDRREPATEHPVYRLLKEQPNEWQTAMEFRERLQSDAELRGNGYALKIMSRGRVVELIRLHPDKVEVGQDRNLRLTYTFTRDDGRRVQYSQAEIFHLRGPGGSDIVGESPIALHRETVGDAIAMQRHGSKVFSNGAFPAGVLQQEVGTKISPESKTELLQDWNDAYQGTANAHKIGFVPGGITYKPLSMNMVDAQYIEGRKFTRSEICSIFGVPPHKIGDLERATFSNIEHQALEFVQDAIVPRCVRWEQAIHRDLLGGDPEFYAKHNVAGLLRGDAKSRAEALQIQRRNGIINPNEWRALEDMNPRDDEGGDEYIVETNMRPDDGTDPNGGEQ